jgi:hypothetical protein
VMSPLLFPSRMEIGFVRRYAQADDDRTSIFQMSLVRMPVDK